MSVETVLTDPLEHRPPPEAPGKSRRCGPRAQFWLLLLPMLTLFGVGFVLPLLNVGRFAFDEFSSADGQVSAWSFSQFAKVLTDDLYRELLGRTFVLALITTLISIVLCYPLAIAVTRGPRRLRAPLMAIIMMPLMVSVVVKTFGWSVLLSGEGVLQGAVDTLGIPVRLLFSPTGVTIGLVHTYMPFMALSLIAAMSAIDRRSEEAATSLGSTPVGVFFKVTLPQTLHGLAAGTVLTFVTSMSALVTPQLLGGGKVSTLVTAIYSQATSAQNWPLASALGVVLLAATFVVLSIHALVVRRAVED